MAIYQSTDPAKYSGKTGKGADYIHEQIQYADLSQGFPEVKGNVIGILGYACDEGVRRNQGRIGAAGGPEAIRSQLAKMPFHKTEKFLIDAGTVLCDDSDLEAAQQLTAQKVQLLLQHSCFPIIIGGG
ncbi:MAG: arginase family protein, partial [Flavobacteriaceae bacterium]|nr:arginase family protein [Flavobacteriaceae bacterium]